MPTLVMHVRGDLVVPMEAGRALAIGMLNLFAGWTIVGWIGALVWACTTDVKTENRIMIEQR